MRAWETFARAVVGSWVILAAGFSPALAEDGPPPSDLSVKPFVTCSPGGNRGPWFAYSGKKLAYIAVTRIYGQPGIILKFSAGQSFTSGGSITGAVGADAGVLFAKASSSLAVQVTGSITTSLTAAGSWKVPPGKNG